MILSDKDIRLRCLRNQIIQPFHFKNIQPASYDFTLGRTFRVNARSKELIDPLVDNSHMTEEFFVDEGQSFLLGPGHFALGITQEYFKIPDDLAAKIEGKSSLGRIGLVIHSTAGWIDPGYQGTITLELGNLSSSVIKLTPGMKIGQICFLQMSTPAEVPYGSHSLGSKYQFSIGPSASLMYLENPKNPSVPGGHSESSETVGDASVPSPDASESTANANAIDKVEEPNERRLPRRID